MIDAVRFTYNIVFFIYLQYAFLIYFTNVYLFSILIPQYILMVGDLYIMEVALSQIMLRSVSVITCLTYIYNEIRLSAGLKSM